MDGLSQLAQLAADEEEYWRAQVEALLPALWTNKGESWVAPVAGILATPIGFRRRLVRAMIQSAKGDLLQIDFSHIEGVLGLLDLPDGSGSGRIQLPGLDVFRSFDWVRFAKPGLDNLENRNFAIALAVPGMAALPDGCEIVTELIDPESVYNECRDELDWSKVSDELILRNWRPGDRYQPFGYLAEEKLKIMFQDARIPLWERRHWPMSSSQSRTRWLCA